jgi:hypothetical protein
VHKTALGEAVLDKAALDKAALDKAGVARMRSKVTAADIAIMARIAAADSPVLDRALPAISRAANYSRLWLGIAAGLAASESKWGRRAALRGVAGIAIASATTNVLGKGLVRRLRPTAEVPLPRRLTRVSRAAPRSLRATPRPPPPSPPASRSRCRPWRCRWGRSRRRSAPPAW